MRSEAEIREMRRDYQASLRDADQLIVRELKRPKPDVDQLMGFHRHRRKLMQFIHLLDLVLGEETGWMPEGE